MKLVVEPAQGFPEGTGRTICRESMRLTLRKPLLARPRRGGVSGAFALPVGALSWLTVDVR